MKTPITMIEKLEAKRLLLKTDYEKLMKDLSVYEDALSKVRRDVVATEGALRMLEIMVEEERAAQKKKE
jgi:hypothetical protein